MGLAAASNQTGCKTEEGRPFERRHVPFKRIKGQDACTSLILLVLLTQVLLHAFSNAPANQDEENFIVNIPLQYRESRVGSRHFVHTSGRLVHPLHHLERLPGRFRLVQPHSRPDPGLHWLTSGEGNENPFNCTWSKTKPAFRICVHAKERDKYISASLLSSGLWEPYVTFTYQQALALYPEAAVIDLGANIGYYTLLAAAMGHSVVAVEPQEENFRRLVEAARSPHLARVSTGGATEGTSASTAAKRSQGAADIVLLANAVSDGHRNVSLTTSEDNQGAVRVLERCQARGWLRVAQAVLRWGWWYPAHTRSDGQSAAQPDCRVMTVTLDDLLLVVPCTTVIIKIDIEGYECRALATAHKFFSALRVPYIFMEWRQMRERQHDQDTHCLPAQILKLARFLAARGYTPHEVRSGVALNPRSATDWVVGDVYWRAAGQKLLVPSW